MANSTPVHPVGFSRRFRSSIAIGLCCVWPACLLAQQAIEPVAPPAPVFWRPYVAPEIPEVRLANSARLADLIRAGKLYLSVHDAIALALENNIDLEVSRYNPVIQTWNVQRLEAGGALPGVTSGAAQAASVTSGQGVLGSQQAAGVSVSNTSATRGTSNASITQIGPVTQTLDPSIQESTTFSHRTIPQPNVVQSITQVLIQGQRIYSGSLQEGFLAGGALTVTYSDHYLNENSPTDVLNPSVAPSLSIQFQQNLLQGFGAAVNGRNITVAKINLQTSDLNFKTQVISTVVTVLNSYHALVADYEDMKAKNSALDAAKTFYSDTKKQVDIGTLADIELTRAASQVASGQQDVVISETGLRRDELNLKNLISRNGIEDPSLASAQIVPLDHLTIPDKDDLPSMKELVEQAMANRSDLAAEKAGITTAEVSALGTKNALLPTLVGFVGESQAGLAGTARPVTFGSTTETANPYFVGGIGTALGQVFRRNFPTDTVGAYFAVPLRDRQAQADYGIDQLQLRQTQLSVQKDVKQAQVDVLNAVVALRQSRARYDAAVRGRILAQQLLDAEQKKYALGASTPYNVIQEQRDLATAQSTEIGSLVTYANARVLLDQTLGATLETNHIAIAEAHAGKVAQVSTVPAVLPAQPAR
jgi:outer membrane protein TolC